MTRVHAYLASLDPRLSRAAWTLELGFLVNAFGTGVSYPFLVIYLHNVRDIGLGTAGLVVATIGAAGLAAGLAVGAVVDRIGPRRMLWAALALLAAGYALFPLVRSPWQAFLAALLVGIGGGAFWPAQLTFLGRLVPAARRHAAWGLQRTFLNLGLGLGGLVGGLIARTDEPRTFAVLFGVNVATSLGYALILVFVSPPGPRRASETQPVQCPAQATPQLRHHPFMGLMGLNVVLIAVGNAQLELVPVLRRTRLA